MKTLRLLVPALAAVAACTPVTTTTTNNNKPAPEEVRRGNSETVHTIGIPPGQLPHAGRCRVWVPGRAPGRQADSRSCKGIASTASPGSWIIYRDLDDSKLHVHVMDPSHRGVIYLVRYYDVDGRWLRDEAGNRHHDADEADDQDHGNGHGNGNGNGSGRRHPGA